MSSRVTCLATRNRTPWIGDPAPSYSMTGDSVLRTMVIALIYPINARFTAPPLTVLSAFTGVRPRTDIGS